MFIIYYTYFFSSKELRFFLHTSHEKLNKKRLNWLHNFHSLNMKEESERVNERMRTRKKNCMKWMIKARLYREEKVYFKEDVCVRFSVLLKVKKRSKIGHCFNGTKERKYTEYFPIFKVDSLLISLPLWRNLLVMHISFTK